MSPGTDIDHEDASPAARKARRNARLVSIMRKLADAPDNVLEWDEAWLSAVGAVPMTADDREMVSGNQPRGENAAKWYMIDLAKAQWILKLGSRLRITPQGRAALQQFTEPDDLMAEASRRYRQWDALRQGADYKPPQPEESSGLVPGSYSHYFVPQVLGDVLRTGLGTGASTFAPDVLAWGPDAVANLQEALSSARGESDTTFAQRLETQMGGVSDPSRLLMAELLSLLLAPLSDWHKDTKRGRVLVPLMAMDEPRPLTQEVNAVIEHGLLHGGPGFKSGLPARLAELLGFVRHWHTLPAEERDRALGSLESFLLVADRSGLADGSLRGLLCFLLFPDRVPAVFSKEHAAQIVSAFATELPQGRTGHLFLDLATVTLALQQDLGQAIDYYEEPLSAEWQAQAPAEAGVWLVRGSSVDGINLVPTWVAQGYVSLRGHGVPVLEPEPSRDEVSEAIAAAFATRPLSYRRQKFAVYDRFLRQMKPEDLVVSTSEGMVHVGRIASDVQWVEDSPRPDRVRREVEWLGQRPFEDVAPSLAARLSNQDDVVSLADEQAVVESMIGPVPKLPALHLPAPTPELADKLHLPLAWLEQATALVQRRKQVILYGPPGTGKTYIARALAEHWTPDPANTTLVQFHPSYAYEDFVMGYRPTTRDDGQVVFELRPGPFIRLARSAREHPTVPHVLIIDEINRANLAKVFGELYFLLEYRDAAIDLLYSEDRGEPFSLPDNVFLIGTMNTADRSIALVDAAMRRRFAFRELHPSAPPVNGVLRSWLARNDHPAEAADLLDALNARITDRDFRIGPSYFMKDWIYSDPDGLETVWESDLLPLLEEHHAGDGTDVAARYGLPVIRARAAKPDA